MSETDCRTSRALYRFKFPNPFNPTTFPLPSRRRPASFVPSSRPTNVPATMYFTQPGHQPSTFTGVDKSLSSCSKSLFLSSVTGARLTSVTTAGLFLPSCNRNDVAGPAFPFVPAGYASQIALTTWLQPVPCMANSSYPAMAMPLIRTIFPSNDWGLERMSQTAASTACARRDSGNISQLSTTAQNRIWFITCLQCSELQTAIRLSKKSQRVYITVSKLQGTAALRA